MPYSILPVGCLPPFLQTTLICTCHSFAVLQHYKAHHTMLPEDEFHIVIHCQKHNVHYDPLRLRGMNI